jgi:hypothetical protein
MPDDVWLEICGRRGWFAFTQDQKFHSIAVEATAIKQHNVGAFCLPGANETTWDKLSYFVRVYPKIVSLTNSMKPPFLYRIHPNLRIQEINLP